MDLRRKQRDRVNAIAYFALWALYELSPEHEREHFKQTRLDLHRHLQSPDDLQPHAPAEAPQHLRLLP